MKLTQKTIAGLAVPAGKTEAVYFDDDLGGFGLRLRATGASRWIYQYKIGAQQRRITLGAVKALSAAQARATANELHAKVRLGHDPAGEQAEGRARAAETMGAVLDSYLAYQRQHLRPRSFVEVERHLRKHCRQLHGLQLAKIDRRAVAARIATIATKSGVVAANRTRASLQAFFAWCLREGLAESNPVVGTGRRPERSRERTLDNAELNAIWVATAGTDDYSAIIRLLATTAARASEIGGLRWSEILGDQIVLPPERTKNGRMHAIPITPPVQAILEGRPRRADRDFIFGRRQDRPFTGWSVCKALLDERLRAAGAELAPWTQHDLRRTVATRLADQGIAPHVISAILNHSDHRRGVHGVYVRTGGYESEKRVALTKWAELLEEIVSGKKPATVIAMPKRN
jgi:integrase